MESMATRRTSTAAQLRMGAAAVQAAREQELASVTEILLGGYYRISDDQEDEETGDRGAGVDRQRDAVTALCLAVSAGRTPVWTVHRHYEDPDVSAFKDVLRPEFERLLADLEAGVIQGIVVYDLDRLARRPKDLERVIDIYDAAHKQNRKLYFRTVHDAIDLSSPDGLTLARVMVAFANKASRDTARRVRDKHKQTALTGRPVSGTRPFGWTWTRKAVKLADGRELPAVAKPEIKTGNQVIYEPEAKEIRRAAADLLLGVAMDSVVKDLNERGVLTAKGNQWSAFTLKQMLLSPRLAGYRVYQGEILVDPKTSQFVRGQWDPILDDDTFTALEDKLLERSAEVLGEQRSEAHRQYLLSGILRCAECLGPLHGNARAKEPEAGFDYVCKVRSQSGGKVGCGKVSVTGMPVDAVIVDALKARMRSDVEDLPDSRVWPREHEITAIKARVAECLDELGDAGGEMAGKVLAKLAQLQAQADELRLERNAWVVEQGVAVRRAQLGARTWEDLTLAEQRAYAKTELVSIFVRPATKQQNRLDYGRLVPVWRDLAPAAA
jgi:site-specific DNA recombinase